MHEFLTFADAEFVPGPRFNLVMGPNGSGKSSIVCALAIALGAKPSILERAGAIGEFVNVATGAEQSFVEVELKNDKGDRKNWVVLKLRGKFILGQGQMKILGRINSYF